MIRVWQPEVALNMSLQFWSGFGCPVCEAGATLIACCLRFGSQSETTWDGATHKVGIRLETGRAFTKVRHHEWTAQRHEGADAGGL